MQPNSSHCLDQLQIYAWYCPCPHTEFSVPQAPNQDALCFQNLYGEWEEQHRCKIITSTRGTFMDMFDDDDTLVYEPAMTAAIILTGEDDEAEKAALEVRQLYSNMLC